MKVILRTLLHVLIILSVLFIASYMIAYLIVFHLNTLVVCSALLVLILLIVSVHGINGGFEK